MSIPNKCNVRGGHARLGVLAAATVVIIGAVFEIDWKYLPVALYTGVVVAWASHAWKKGIWPSCTLALRCLLTGVASFATMCIFLLVVAAVISAWSLVVDHHFDIDTWRDDLVPNMGHESPEWFSQSLLTCLVVASVIGAIAGLANWFIASRRWAILGVVGFPLLWLTMYWSESFKPGQAFIETRAPFFGALDGGLIITYLSTVWITLGGWLGDRSRVKKLGEHQTTGT